MGPTDTAQGRPFYSHAWDSRGTAPSGVIKGNAYLTISLYQGESPEEAVLVTRRTIATLSGADEWDLNEIWRHVRAAFDVYGRVSGTPA